jgi:hypothetical protein
MGVDAVDQAVLDAAIGDQLGDGPDLQRMALREGDEIRQPRHGAVFVHDLADDARRYESGHARDIDRRFGMARAHQDPAIARGKRKHMPRRHEILAAPRGIDRHLHGTRAVGGGNARGDALPGLDRNRERRLVPRAVIRAHQRQAELADALLRHGKADQAARMLRHEIDGVGRRHLCGNDEIALILAILVIDQDEHPAVAGVFNNFFGRR